MIRPDQDIANVAADELPIHQMNANANPNAFGGLQVDPTAQMWQVNPGAEAVDPEDLASE
ncbi:hypothetical protein [Brevibacillus dissolubilis]|uniref:hypothetical protein n=1 Tax=Brevibacillus dissolubilis TaxID=1844116 RepID=UPI001115E01C|nr:hypothetical protein [Brevibacillus dissolubilis]